MILITIDYREGFREIKRYSSENDYFHFLIFKNKVGLKPLVANKLFLNVIRSVFFLLEIRDTLFFNIFDIVQKVSK